MICNLLYHPLTSTVYPVSTLLTLDEAWQSVVNASLYVNLPNIHSLETLEFTQAFQMTFSGLDAQNEFAHVPNWVGTLEFKR